MGKPLGWGNRAYIVQPDNAAVTLPLAVPGSKHFNAGVSAAKHRLVHNTACAALTDPDLERINLGVGEYVSFSFDPPLNMTWPEQPWWLAFQGSVSPAFGESTEYTAPSNAAGAIVRVFVRDVQLDTSFQVREPSGVDQARTYKTGNMPFDAGESAAGMKLRVYLAPTVVSFYRLECKEEDVNVMNLEGYYADTSRIPLPYQQLRHQGAGVPFAIFQDNSWEHGNVQLNRDWDTCYLRNSDVPPVLYQGKFKWYIPLKWKIPGSTADWKHIENYYQEFEVKDDGEMTVKKFGKQVTRGMWE
jgi:hypothetical protein